MTKSENELALSKFQKSIKLIDNRYEIGLPWIDQITIMPNNYGLAKGRLNSLIKSHQTKNLEFLKKYHEIIANQLEQNIVEIVKNPWESTDTLIHYIPHQPVIRDQKSFTKIRVVYDASARLNRSSPSLNSCLLKGPDLSSNLFGMLLRSRFSPILIISDVEKAFLQISIIPNDRNCLRFLWVKKTASFLLFWMILLI